MRRVGAILFILLLATYTLPSRAGTDALNNFTLYSEVYPPFNYVENGEIKGLGVDLLMEVFRRLDIKKTPADIVIAPWARGYSQTQVRKNTMLFSTVRTPEREHLFKWVGPFGLSTASLVALKRNPIDIKAGTAINQYKYGVVKSYPAADKILAAGVSPDQLMYVNSPQSALHMLARGRFDAWIYDNVAASWMIEALGYNQEDFHIVHKLDKSQYYYAFNKDTDDALIERMQEALDDIRSDNILMAISDKYFSTIATAEHMQNEQH